VRVKHTPTTHTRLTPASYTPTHNLQHTLFLAIFGTVTQPYRTIHGLFLHGSFEDNGGRERIEDRKSRIMRHQRRILVARTDRLGDVVLTLPALRELRRAFPDAFIAVMVRPYALDIVKNDPHIDEVILYDKDGALKGLFQTFRFAFSLKKYRFDSAIAFHPNNRTHLIFFLAGIPLRAGYDRNMPFFLTIKIPHEKQKGAMHESAYNLDLLEKAGIRVSKEDLCPMMRTSDDEKTLVDKVLTEREVKSRFVTIHAGASCLSKIWSYESFAEVSARINRELGLDIVLIGSVETQNINGKIVKILKKGGHDLAGVLTVGETAELLRRSALLISNDSGPVHIASAVGTPSVVIFGRKDPGLSPLRWGPLGKNDKVLHKDPGCTDCLAHKCLNGFRCLYLVTAKEVFDSAVDIISRQNAGSGTRNGESGIN
jgi:heptosyltransferase-2